MKFAVFCLLAVISVYVYAEEYTNKFDNINVDEILNNNRLLKRYVDCLLDKPDVRCPAEATELKSEYCASQQTKMDSFCLSNPDSNLLNPFLSN